jgi:hypothetical protein
VARRRPAAGASPAAPAGVAPISPPPAPLAPTLGCVPNEAACWQVRTRARWARRAQPGEGRVETCPQTRLPAQPGARWRPLLRASVAAYRAALGDDRLVGVFLRGSLPRGLFLPGVSDVDAFALALAPDGGRGGGGGGAEGASAARAAVAAALVPALTEEQGRLGFVKVRAAGARHPCPLVSAPPRRPGPDQPHDHHPCVAPPQFEVKVLLVPEASAAGRALRRAMARDGPPRAAALDDERPAASGAAADPTRAGWRLRPHIAHRLPAAFELASQSAALWGLDLPALMPDTAALPGGGEAAPALEEDVSAARAAAEAPGAGGGNKGGEAAATGALPLPCR